MTKILLITNDFPPAVGGIARWYERICAALPPSSVVVLAPRMPDDRAFDERQAYTIVRVRVPTSRRPLARLLQLALLCVRAIGTARRERAGAVHIGQLQLAPIGLVLARLLKTPFVVYLHGGELAPYMRLGPVRAAVRAIVRRARTVVVNSAYTLRHFGSLGIALPQAEILTMSAETDRFHPAADASRVRARYGINGHKTILTVARLDDYKGHDMVIRALPRLREAVGTVRYLVVGRGREEHRLRMLAETLGCADGVVFAGHVPEGDLPSVYAACDVFVMPSRPLPNGDFEGFGLVFLEAGACGRPVVGGRSGGVPEAVLDGVTGILVNPTDVGEISGALTRLLLDREEAARLGTQGRRRAEQLESSWRTTLARIVA